MLSQPMVFAIDAWIIVHLLLALGAPTLLPIIAGFSYASRSFWVSERLGFFIGLGVSLGGTSAYFAFMLREFFFPELFFVAGIPYRVFGGLAVLLAIQLSLVVGACWLVARQKERSWKRDVPRFRL